MTWAAATVAGLALAIGAAFVDVTNDVAGIIERESLTFTRRDDADTTGLD